MAIVGYNRPPQRGTLDAVFSPEKRRFIVTEKSEIMEMPEGKSSQEIDDIMMEGEDVEEINQPTEPKVKDDSPEALDATEPSPAEEPAEEKPEAKAEEEKPELSEDQKQLQAKDSKIASLKHEHRDMELENARLQGELETRKSMQVKAEEPVKSPLEIAEAAYIEEFGSLPDGGLPMTGELYRKQAAFDSEQVATVTATEKKEQTDSTLLQTAETLQSGELSAEKMGTGLDLQSVSNLGDKHLTRGDKIDIQDIQKTRGTAAALKMAYDKMIGRIAAAGGEDAKTLENAMTKSQTKPKKEPTDIDKLTTEGEDGNTGEAETVTVSQRLTNFMFEPE